MRAGQPIGLHMSGDHAEASGWFARMANATARWSGKPAAFMLAFGIVVVWAIIGPIFHYSDTWQLVINTGTRLKSRAVWLRRDRVLIFDRHNFIVLPQ